MSIAEQDTERDEYGWPVDDVELARECYEMSLPSFSRAWGNPEDAIYDEHEEEETP